MVLPFTELTQPYEYLHTHMTSVIHFPYFAVQEQQKELKNQEELSSQVWICTSTHSATKVIIIDAIQPGNILDSFTVCNSHVLCIASVPGESEQLPPCCFLFPRSAPPSKQEPILLWEI